jgi:hypothetical protein
MQLDRESLQLLAGFTAIILFAMVLVILSRSV